MAKFSRYFPTTSIGVYLMAMAVMTALPILAFVFFLLSELEHNENEKLRRETVQDAQIISRAVERRLLDMATTLRLLSTSPELESGDLAAFQNRVAGNLRAGSMYLVLIGADGAQHLNSRIPYGSPLGRMSNMLALESALASKRVDVSDVFFGKTSQQWVFNVTLPLPPELEKAGAAMALTQNAGDLASLTTADGLPRGWTAAVIDGHGHVVVSSGPDNRPSGDLLPADMRPPASGASESAIVVGEHQEIMLGYARLPGWSWQVVVWGPTAAAQATLASTWRQLFFGSMVLLSLGLLVAWSAAQQLRSSVTQIALMAEQIGKGEIVSPVVTKIVEANQVAIALSNASFDRSQAEERVNFILHELVHRTKNILALVQAMMRQIARSSDNIDDFQRAINSRLAGLAGSMEALARAQWDGIPMSRLAELQISTVTGSFEQVELHGADFTLNANAVQNLGLAFHELATNSVKYGALSVPTGRVSLNWQLLDEASDDPRLSLLWKESGGPPVTVPERRGFGSTIIERHSASAFSGNVELDFAKTGLSWKMIAPYRHFIVGKPPLDDDATETAEAAQ